MTTPTAQPATPELLATVAKSRSDLDLDDLRAAIADAEARGWTFGQIFVHVARMCARGEDVRDLRAALRRPYGARSP